MRRKRSLTNREDGNDAIQQRRRKAFALRTEQRLSFRRIAEIMRDDPSVPAGYDQVSALRDVRAVLAMYERENASMAGAYVEELWLEHEQNKQAILDNIKKMAERIGKGDIRAIRTAIASYAEVRKILDLQARLRGLYPKEVVFQQNNNLMTIGNTTIDLSDRSQTLVLARAMREMIEEDASN